MITKMNIALVLGILLAGLQAGELAAQSQSKKEGSGAKKAMGEKMTGTVLLKENFESQDVDSSPDLSELERDEMVTVIDGGGKVGSGKVLHFNDDDTDELGAMELNVRDSALGSMYIEFAALNNDNTKGDKSSAVIFGVGPWGSGRGLTLNSKSKRAFGFELYQQKHLRLRVGDTQVSKLKYDAAAAFNVKIWANDHDEKKLTYKRPDNGEAAELGADSVVVWVNNALMTDLKASGTPMNKEVTEGNAVIGRAGLSSASSKVADFLFDNLHIEDPSTPAKSDEK